MKRFIQSGLILLSLMASQPLWAWESCEQWGNFSDSGFTVYNNIWGGGAGSQCVWANSYSNWGVRADHPNTGGIKSYPNVSREVDFQVDDLGSCNSSFNVSRPAGGAYSSTYDIWFDDHSYELMVWMNWTGAVSPISYNYDASGQPVPEARNVTVGGNTWNIYRGSNGYNTVFSFLRTSHSNSGSIDIQAITKWLRAQAWFGNAHLHKIEFGFEITSSAGGAEFAVNDYSLACAAGNDPVPPVDPQPPVDPNPPTDPNPPASGSIPDGRYALISQATGRAIEVEGRGSNNGADLVQRTYREGLYQQFDVKHLGNGNYSIRAAHSGKAIDVYEFNMQQGGELRQWDFTGADNQLWKMDSLGNGAVSILSLFSGMAIEASTYSWWRGGEVQQSNYTGSEFQQWKLQPVQ